MKKFGLYFLFIAFFTLVQLACSSSNLYAGKCFAKETNFSVTEPYLINKACFLFYHGINVPLRSQADFIITRPEQLHSDPLQEEFYKLVLAEDILPIQKNTPLFDCKYDLEVVAKDFRLNRNTAGKGKILGYTYPEFNCYGRMSKFVQVRPVNRSKCYWVAIETIKCND